MKTRIKTHQMPGDVPKRIKIDMLEGRPTGSKRQPISKQQGKKYKKWMILSREKAVMKERLRYIIKNQCE